MTDGTIDSRRTAPRGDLRAILIILITGTVLGLAYNWFGLENPRHWGLAWISEDRLDQLESTVVEEPAAMTPRIPVSDDPLAIPGDVTVDLPEIPDVGRPVKIQLGAVKAYFDADAALFVDAREPEEYELSHIPGSINLPFNSVVSDPAALEAIDTGGRPIITYCGGGTCELSLSLAEELIWTGFTPVAVYMGGFPQWEEAGHPVEQGGQ